MVWINGKWKVCRTCGFDHCTNTDNSVAGENSNPEMLCCVCRKRYWEIVNPVLEEMF